MIFTLRETFDYIYNDIYQIKMYNQVTQQTVILSLSDSYARIYARDGTGICYHVHLDQRRK